MSIVYESPGLFEQKASAALEHLGLSVALTQLDQAAQQASAHDWSYTHFLGYLLDAELAWRQQRTVKLNLQFAHLPYHKRLEQFDFSAQPSIDRRLLDELATGRFLSEGRNVIFQGPPGVGKSHLAIALGIAVAELGYRIYFTTAIHMARRLTQAMVNNRLKREMNNLVRPRLLIIDEVGYLKLDPTQASLLFQVIAERYERQLPIVLTSNKAFAEWDQVFAADAVMAAAALDRLLHRATVLNIKGDSYRLRERRQAGASDPPPARRRKTETNS